MMIVLVLLAGIVSYGISWVLIRRFVAKRKQFDALIDTPNVRSSHKGAKLRVGGIGMVAGVLVSWAAYRMIGGTDAVFHHDWAFLLGFLSMALLGFFSDLSELSPSIRIAVQTVIAACVVLLLGGLSTVEIAGLRLELGVGGILAGILWVTAAVNFYNFMDGIDGLAAMQGIVAGGALACFGLIDGNRSLVWAGLVLSSVTFGFLMLNVTPARIFMGDVGSYALGFYIAGVALLNNRLLLPIALVLGVFLFDPVVTLFRRAVRGEQLYKAHRGHFYQRAVGTGFTHMQVTGVLSVVSILLSVLACLYLKVSSPLQLAILAGVLAGLSGLAFWITAREHRYARTTV